jgi:hypothetical protein
MVTPVRMRWANYAMTLAGLAAPSDAYRELVAPERLEGKGLSDEMLRMWSCALAWLGLARCMGVIEGAAKLGLDMRELDSKYIPGRAMSDCVAVAVKCGAWRSYRGPEYPAPRVGDGVIVGPGGYHMRACIVWVNDDGTYDVVEGGHITGAGDPRGVGRMCIERVKGLHLIEQGGALYFGSHAGPDTHVYGWIDCEALPAGELADEIISPAHLLDLSEDDEPPTEPDSPQAKRT